MLTRIITIMIFAVLLCSCVTREQATLYAIQDLKHRVDREVSGEPLPKAWGDSWLEHWKEQYHRLKVYDKHQNAEKIIKAIEQERIGRASKSEL